MKQLDIANFEIVNTAIAKTSTDAKMLFSSMTGRQQNWDFGGYGYSPQDIKNDKVAIRTAGGLMAWIKPVRKNNKLDHYVVIQAQITQDWMQDPANTFKTFRKYPPINVDEVMQLAY